VALTAADDSTEVVERGFTTKQIVCVQRFNNKNI
jgi:hypothetical protein